MARPLKIKDVTRVNLKSKDYIIDRALKNFFETESSLEAKVKLLEGVLRSDKGKLWIAQHIIGDPNEIEMEAKESTNSTNSTRHIPIINFSDITNI